jgi:hypothetical protein
MLPEIHAALRTMLYQEGAISPDEVEIWFRAPTREWADSLTRPALNLHMLHMEENLDLRETAYDMVRRQKTAEFRLPPRRIDLRYVVSAFTAEPDDELRLLWRALAVLMRHQEFPMALLPEGFRDIKPPLPARVLQGDEGPKLLDVWSALSLEPRPAFGYTITAPLDLDLALSTPLVLTRTLRVGRLGTNGQPATDGVEGELEIGGLVLDRHGQGLPGIGVTVEGRATEATLTDGAGRFKLRGIGPGKQTLRARRRDGRTQTAVVDVPATSYDIVLD